MKPNVDAALRALMTLAGTRRQTLFAFLAAASAGAGAAPATGKRRGRRKRCKGDRKRCGAKCVRGTCCPGKACGRAEPNCRCARSVEGRAFCQTGGLIKVDPCASSAECGPGEACIPDGGLSFCIPSCGSGFET